MTDGPAASGERGQANSRRAHRVWLAAALLAVLATPGARAVEVLDITDNQGTETLMDRLVTIQPIALCTDAGNFCAKPLLDAERLARTFAQAGVATVILPSRTLNNTALSMAPSVTDFNVLPGLGRSSNAQTLNVWFLRNVPNRADKVLYGEANKDGNGAIINTRAVNGGTWQEDGSFTKPRLDTLAHEIGHNLGVDHHWFLEKEFVMTSGKYRTSPSEALDAGEIGIIRGSPFLQATPRVDFQWTKEPGSLTRLSISFLEGVVGMGVDRISIDLPDSWAGGWGGQKPATFEAVLGNIEYLGDVAISYRENMFTYVPSGGSDGDGSEGEGGGGLYTSTNGLPELEIVFTDPLVPGDALSFDFGIRANLRNEYEYFEPRDLSGAVIDIDYNFGLSSRGTVLADSSSFDARAMGGLRPSVENPAPFGVQLAPGDIPPVGTLADGFETVAAVPEPQTWAMLLAGLAFIASRARSRNRRLSLHFFSCRRPMPTTPSCCASMTTPAAGVACRVH